MGQVLVNERERLRAQAVEASGSGIAIADMRQRDYPIIDVNPAFERMTGYAAKEILGRNCRILQGRTPIRRRAIRCGQRSRPDGLARSSSSTTGGTARRFGTKSGCHRYSMIPGRCPTI
jgi:PAS domain S-box-containing protein